jgi:uncharacterized repeat protein (TIGR03803 family)
VQHHSANKKNDMRSHLPFSRLFALTSFAAVAAAAVLASARTASAQPAFQVLHSFGPSSYREPTEASQLIQATDGDFYGTTFPFQGTGTVFKMTPGGTVTVLHTFVGGTTDGLEAQGSLIQASNGTFYGTTIRGGAFNAGTVFEMTPAGAFSVLHSFAGGTTDGAYPQEAVIQASDGNFYGTTLYGGTFNAGTVFELTPTGTLSVLHSFAGGTVDGCGPSAALIQATDGNFYGTTAGCGSATGSGTVFKMTPAGTVTVLHAFSGGPLGPLAALIQGANGNFYGINSGYADSYGTVFEITPAGIFTVLHAFAGGPMNGPGPGAGLIQGNDGNLYGTARWGGAYGAGVVFRLATGPRAGGPADFDGNGQADPTVYRPSTGQWFILHSSTTYTTSTVVSWGSSTDIAVPGDYDGDGTTDIAVYRPSTGTWYILYSSTGSGVSVQWGNGADDHPVSGDFDGDGKTDIAVYRPSTSTWHILSSRTGRAVIVQWGNSLDDRPVSGDFDGDGTSDIAVYRPSTSMWYILSSRTGRATSVQWGNSSDDQPVSGDFDGDGKADIAVYRPSTGTWYILCSSTNRTTDMVVSWGTRTDIPVSGDFDGDGKTDPAVFRPSTGEWFVLKSSANFAQTSSQGAASSFVVSWGARTDTPIEKRP